MKFIQWLSNKKVWCSFLQAVIVNKIETSYEYQDLLPYSEYNVYVYSVVINKDGNEVKSPSQPQNVLIYYEGYLNLLCKDYFVWLLLISPFSQNIIIKR